MYSMLIIKPIKINWFFLENNSGLSEIQIPNPIAEKYLKIQD